MKSWSVKQMNHKLRRCAIDQPKELPKTQQYLRLETSSCSLFPHSQYLVVHSIKYPRHQLFDPSAHLLCSSMPTIQYLSTNPTFSPFNLPLLRIMKGQPGDTREKLKRSYIYLPSCRNSNWKQTTSVLGFLQN